MVVKQLKYAKYYNLSVIYAKVYELILLRIMWNGKIAAKYLKAFLKNVQNHKNLLAWYLTASLVPTPLRLRKTIFFHIGMHTFVYYHCYNYWSSIEKPKEDTSVRSANDVFLGTMISVRSVYDHSNH